MPPMPASDDVESYFAAALRALERLTIEAGWWTRKS